VPTGAPAHQPSALPTVAPINPKSLVMCCA
jgi:hypothetical protein